MAIARIDRRWPSARIFALRDAHGPDMINEWLQIHR
jgi:hypothetical protein